MTNPRVTVLMAVYNGEKYLREAIESILDQTFKDFEFLIINDGSTDSTKKIILSYDDSRIRLVDNEKNMGLTCSLNKGLRLAKGEYIARQDADDVSLPVRLEKQVKFLEENPEVGLVGTWYRYIDEASEEIGKTTPPVSNNEIRKNILKRNQFAHGSVMFSKRCLVKVGFYREQFKVAQDYDLWLRISEKYKIANIPLYLYKWRFTYNFALIRKKIEWDKYAKLARKLAKERKLYEKDILQNSEKEKFNAIFVTLFYESRLERIKNLSKSYFYFGKLLIQSKSHQKRARQLFLWSLLLNPFYFQTYHLLALSCFPFVLIRVIRKTKRILKQLSNY